MVSGWGSLEHGAGASDVPTAPPGLGPVFMLVMRLRSPSYTGCLQAAVTRQSALLTLSLCMRQNRSMFGFV